MFTSTSDKKHDITFFDKMTHGKQELPIKCIHKSIINKNKDIFN